MNVILTRNSGYSLILKGGLTVMLEIEMMKTQKRLWRSSRALLEIILKILIPPVNTQSKIRQF